MAADINQNTEQIARDKIDEMLRAVGWIIQSKNEVDLFTNKGIAVREYLTDVGLPDYVLFVDKKPVGIIDAKPEDEGHRLTVVEELEKLIHPSSKLIKGELKDTYFDLSPLNNLK